jgi:cysteinyl-tRNA synthetase
MPSSHERGNTMTQQVHDRRQAETREVSPGLRLFNTLARQKEVIEPLEAGHIRMYSCGPTVYRFIHIGNLRTFAMADWIRRTLETQGLRVTHVKNITDVGHMRQELLDRGEDKLIAQARKEGKTTWEIAQFYTDAFMNDEAQFNILPAHIFPRATQHIPEMIALTQKLLENGHAYEAGGNVFFSVGAFSGYGRLSGNLLEHLGEGQHIANENDPFKRAPEDFPLWKVAEPGRLMAWDSPWGRGFPGWHIECSAMSIKYLGEQFDIHTGGVDNIFPHHEDERAQSEAATGKAFARYWVHGQHLLADGLKMAKSSGNAYVLADIVARGFEPMALRYLFTTAHYRTQINFTFRALTAAQTALHRLRRHVRTLWQRADGQKASSDEAHAHPYWFAFLAAVDDDLNLPRGIAVVWRMVRDASLSPKLRLALLDACDAILGLDLIASATRQEPAIVIPEPVLDLARQREGERAKRNYPVADELREQIRAAGFAVGDTPQGTRLTPRVERESLISGWRDVPSRLEEPAHYGFSINLIAHNSRDDLQRCVESIARHAGEQSIELVIVDNGSTDDTLDYLKVIHREGKANGLPAQVLFADHDMGFAAGRNATFRSSLGEIVVMIDTSIEIAGDIWTPIAQLLADPTVGIVGPYGLVTTDLKEFAESRGPDVDAMEGYLMAFRRSALLEVGPADEKFRFYRLMDIDYSFEFKKAGFRVVVSPEVADRVVKHPHREWYSLLEEEQTAKSKKNFDIFRRKRHHCQSLLVMNYRVGQPAPWGHDHEIAAGQPIDPRFEHLASEEEAEHSHEHKHWPDHSHTHSHRHLPAPRWFAPDASATYEPSIPNQPDQE